MISLMLSLGMFATALVAHVVVWRIRLPRKPYVVMAAIFLVVVPALAAVLPAVAVLPWNWRTDSAAIVAALMCHLALSLAYIETYTAVEADSASLTIALFLADAAGRGRTREEIQALFSDDFVVGTRLTSLVQTGFLERRGERLVLAEKGRKVARLYAFVRKLYRLQVGG